MHRYVITAIYNKSTPISEILPRFVTKLHRFSNNKTALIWINNEILSANNVQRWFIVICLFKFFQWEFCHVAAPQYTTLSRKRLEITAYVVRSFQRHIWVHSIIITKTFFQIIFSPHLPVFMLCKWKCVKPTF